MSQKSFELGMMFFTLGLIIALVMVVGGIIDEMNLMGIIAGSIFGAICIGNMISVVVTKRSE